MLLIVDGTHLAYRVKFGFGSQDLSWGGDSTAVMYGFILSLTSIIHKLQPDSVMVCWDAGRPAFRSEIIQQYKASRNHEADPDYEAFKSQLKVLRTALAKFGIFSVWGDELEADDLMYAASRLSTDDEVYILTSDADMYQCITRDGRIIVWNHWKDNPVFNWYRVIHDYQVSPDQWVDYKTLIGDKSDGIPGVQGIGPVMAQRLLSEYITLDTVIQMLDRPEWAFTASVRNKLVEAQNSLPVDQIRRVVDLSVTVQASSKCLLQEVQVWKKANIDALEDFCMEYGFSSLLDGRMNVYRMLKCPGLDTNQIGRYPLSIVTFGE